MIILGINAYHADASAAIFRDGQLLAAVEEERFTRVKHTAGFPARAIRYCLDVAGVRPEEIDHVAIPRKRSAHLFHKAVWAIRLPRMARTRTKAWQRFGDIKETVAYHLGPSASQLRAQFHFVEHHTAHAASSFYPSPFQEAAVLTLDGLGDFASMAWGTGLGKDLKIEGFVLFPHSLGFYYTALTQYLGFWKYGDEYKVMGLASYGEPRYAEFFERMVRQDGGLDFRLDLRYFVHHREGASMSWMEGEPEQGRLFSEALEQELGPARKKDELIQKHHQDVAATLQWRLEEMVFSLLNRLYDRTRLSNLAYAGGVAFNCVANGKIFDRTPFEEVYIQPAAGDAGLAIGSALYVYHQVLGYPRNFTMPHAYWGPEFSPDMMRGVLEEQGIPYREVDAAQMVGETAAHIERGRVVGWYQGRTEWGPRALGNRSILVDPRRSDMKDILNQRVKHREPFRPFAPSVLEEQTAGWFQQSYPSPFMLLAYPVLPEKRSEIPAPTHVDGTGRLHTVSRGANPQYWELLRAFEGLTGVPVLLNTSFNENEPIVNTPEEAVQCFLRTKMDVLALGPFLVEKGRQN
ncbi:MAG: carbamoyltransferase [Dehalococcoidia bacterium]